MSEIAKIEREAAQPTDPIVATIEKVVMNPDLPMERLTALLDIRERQMMKEAEQAFNAAFASAMAEMPDVPRTGNNKHLGRKYATLDDLIRTSRPVLARHGLSLNWQTGIDGDHIWVRAIVRHALGHSIQTEQRGPRDKSGSMNELQGGGSTETYLKRYTGFAILGVSAGDEQDDDGHGSGAPSTISEEQRAALAKALTDSGMDPLTFHRAFGHRNPEQADLAEFPAARFKEAMDRLDAYAKAKAAQKEKPNG